MAGAVNAETPEHYNCPHFELVGELQEVKVIAVGSSIRERRRLWKAYGRGSRRKLKGIGLVRLGTGVQVLAELHW
jgi:hypothetical protein